jgi:glutamate N-acetyltransferase/amino-acid N-acetyltransferase
MTKLTTTRRMPAVPGFLAAGLAAGIKVNGEKDLALIHSEAPAAAAGVFTRNRARSPSVLWCERVLKNNAAIRAVLINSGNANACVGPQGMADCKNLAAALAGELGISTREILIASTGVIGVPLPTERMVDALPRLTKKLSASGWNQAARAILTTDLAVKTASCTYTENGKEIVVAGIGKGSGMIHPNMATMLGFVQTSAVINAPTLKRALKEAVDASFNRITVDGDTSTNDAVLALASGRAETPPVKTGTRAYARFVNALTGVCRDLAIQIVKDGEGATKFVTVRVVGARTQAQAHKVASSVATSSLVKTALFGEDPNWGRILAAAGNAGVPIRPEKMTISLGGALLFENGTPSPATSKKALMREMRKKTIVITLDLMDGGQSTEMYTCDLSYDYIKINAEYTT